MNTRIASCVIVGLFLLRVPASGQDLERTPAAYVDPVSGISLKQAIARGLAEEPMLREARARIEIARGMHQQAGLRPNPSVSVERREEPSGTDNQTMVGLEWPLDLFRKAGRVAVAEREIAVEESRVADQERLVAADIRFRYGQVLAAIRNLATSDSLLANTRKQHQLLVSRVDEGSSAPLDRDVVAVEVNRLEAERLLQQGETEAALIELARALGMSPTAALLVSDTLEGIVQAELTLNPHADASERRSDVRQAEVYVELAKSEVDRAERGGRFDVSLFGYYSRMDAGFPQRGFSREGSIERVRGQFHYVSAGTRIILPLLNRNQGEIAAARAEIAAATAAREGIRLTAETEITAARARDDRAHQAAKLYRSGISTLAQQNLTVVNQSYELGRMTIFDVLAEQRRYLEIERAYTDTLRAAYEARTALKRALGVVR
jgi:outer membrane protein, heavy metal efflux system